jgi:hypothetical protein
LFLLKVLYFTYLINYLRKGVGVIIKYEVRYCEGSGVLMFKGEAEVGLCQDGAMEVLSCEDAKGVLNG